MKKEKQTVLKIRNLTKIYPGSGGVPAIDRISLDVSEGEIIAVLGPSGAGKSTFLRCLNRLVTISGGNVIINGEDITRCWGSQLRKLRSDVGMVFQQFNLVPRLTVFENVLAGRLQYTGNPFWFAASTLRAFSEANKQKAFEALKMVGIEHLAAKRADSLSGGQQQRVSIARTLAQEPQVILADEPVASLDPASSQRVLGILKDICELKGIPVIINLHQVDLAREFAERVIGIHEGSVVFDDAVERFTPKVETTIYGTMLKQKRYPRKTYEVTAA